MGYRDSTSVVIFCYPWNAGGKFLINCLALSNDCYLQDLQLVTRQRAGALSPLDKFELLNHELDLINEEWHDGVYEPGTWADFRMGCNSLFTDSKDPSKFSSVVHEIAEEPKRFFVVAHTDDHLNTLLEIWPNATLVYFENNNKFLKWRTGQVDTSLDMANKISKIKQLHKILYWDADFYLAKLFVNKVEELYQQLGLLDFNRHYIQTFHARYMFTLQRLKELQLK